MKIGVVISHKETFFSFRDNQVLIKLKTPVFQIVVQDRGITCTSKKAEFFLRSDLKDFEVKVMGKDYTSIQFKGDFQDLKSSFWISTRVDSGSIEDKLNGIAKTASDGKLLFLNEFQTLMDAYLLIQKQAAVEIADSKAVIKNYCDKNIDILSEQIRHLTSEKNVYQDLKNIL